MVTRAEHRASEPHAGQGDAPEGWLLPQVRDVVTINYGKGLTESNRSPGTVPVYGSNGQVGHHDKALTSSPCIVIGRKGSIGAVHISKEPCWPIDTTYFIDDFGGLSPDYVFYALRQSGLDQLDTSTAIPGLNRDDVYSLQFPLPPVAEQRRIVAKVEELLARVDAGRERLDRVPKVMKRFRQAVLAAACSGRLTEGWRAQNEEAAPVEFGVSSDDLPDSWRESSLSNVVRVTSGEAFKKSEYSPSGVKLLQIANVSFGEIIWEQENFLPPSYLKSHAELVLNEGDILMALNRPLLNRRIKVARLTRGDTPAILYQRVGRFSFIGGKRSINPDFLFLFLQSFGFIHELSERLRGTDQPYVNPPEMLEILFPVPPLPEQQEIVRRIEALFKLADAIEKRVAAGRLRADKLTQSILAKAFRGDLVPTEAELARREGRDYEPASVLLERIRVEREKGKPQAKKGRTRG